MVHFETGYAAFGKPQDRMRQIGRISRRSDLVVHHVQRIAFAAQPQHRLNEIIPVLRVEPCGTNHAGIAPARFDRLLSGQFRAAVNALRRGRTVFLQRMTTLPVEHVIGRNMDQTDPALPGDAGQHFRALHVDFRRRFGIAFGPVHRRIGRTVDDQVDRMFLRQSCDTRPIRDIRLRDIGKYEPVLRVHSGNFLQRTTQLPISAGNQYIHSLIQYAIKQYGIAQQRMMPVFL